MNFIFRFILISLLSLLELIVFAQKTPKLYIGIAGLNNAQKNFFSKSNIPIAYIFYQKEIASTEGDTLDEYLFEKKINEKIPDHLQTGIAVLDWETPTLFRENPDSNSYMNVLNEFIRCIKLAKKLRPEIKWGYYGLPLRTFNGVNQKWLAANERLKQLLAFCDFLAPSLYLYDRRYFSNSEEFRNSIISHNTKTSGDYLLDNLNEALKMGKDLDKEVYPFIWHRMNSGNNNLALSLIPVDIFRTYVNLIITASYDGKSVNGVIWWDSQQYYYLNRRKYRMLFEEYGKVVDADQYNYDLLKKYFSSISEFFK